MDGQERVADIAKQYKIKLVYLYGSYARNQQNTMSDIDLAVLFEDELPKKEYLDYQLSFGGEIEKTFALEKVDVRGLNFRSPRFNFTIYSEGVLLFAKDEDTRIGFQLQTFREYNDHKYIYDLSDYYLLQRLKNRDYSIKI